MTEIRDNILSGTWSRGFQLTGVLEFAPPGHERDHRASTIGAARPRRACPTRTCQREFVNWSGPVNQAINLEIEAENLVTLNPEGTSFKLLETRMIEPGAALQREFKLPAKRKK